MTTFRELKIKESGEVTSVGDPRLKPHTDATTNVHGIADTSALATKAYADNAAATAAAGVVDAAPATLDTLNELAAALGDDPNYATTTATALGNRVRVDASQSFTAGEKTQARNNIDAVSATDSRLSDTRTPTDGSVTTAKIADGAVTAAKLAAGAAVPGQTGQSGKYLTTDGTTASWGTIDLSSKVSKSGDSMSGALTMQGADIKLEPSRVSIGTVTAQSSSTIARTMTATNAAQVEGGYLGSVNMTVRLGSSPTAQDVEWVLGIAAGTVITINDSVWGSATFTVSYVFHNATPMGITEMDGVLTAGGFENFYGPGYIGSTTTLSYPTNAYVLTTNATSISIPTTHFRIGSTTYETSSATLSGGNITLFANPGSVVGSAVYYLTTTPASLRAVNIDGTSSAISYDPVQKRWEADGQAFAQQPLAHEEFATLTLTVASPTQIVNVGGGDVVLPDVALLDVGYKIEIVNASGLPFSVLRSDGFGLGSIPNGQTGTFVAASGLVYEQWLKTVASSLVIPSSAPYGQDYVLAANYGESAWVSTSSFGASPQDANLVIGLSVFS